METTLEEGDILDVTAYSSSFQSSWILTLCSYVESEATEFSVVIVGAFLEQTERDGDKPEECDNGFFGYDCGGWLGSNVVLLSVFDIFRATRLRGDHVFQRSVWWGLHMRVSRRDGPIWWAIRMQLWTNLLGFMNFFICFPYKFCTTQSDCSHGSCIRTGEIPAPSICACEAVCSSGYSFIGRALLY